jgi:hypothetical protein
MARSRNIKPGFFTNEQLAECEPLARLLFAGLWCVADREGRLHDRPKRIRIEILPYDECDIDALLGQLHANKLIARYQVGGGNFIQIVNFLKHQDPHYKEKASDIPSMVGHIDSGITAGGVSEHVRQDVFDRDGRKCVECGSTENLSLDHIVPRTSGGGHGKENLQTLCRRCNSSKNNRLSKSNVNQSLVNGRSMVGQSSPVSAPSDSLNLIPSSLIPDSLISDSLIPDSLNPQPSTKTTSAARAKKPRATAGEGKTAAVWESYKNAYFQRYGVDPVRNSKVSGMLGLFVDRVGSEEAPHIAAHYVQHQQALYVRARHCVDLLLRDAEGLRMEWATGKNVTATEARMGDQTAAIGNVFNKLIKELDNG